MPASPTAVSESPALSRIRHYLEGLQRTPDGSVLHGMIERGLRKYSTRGERIEETFYTFLQALLARYVRDPDSSPATRFKARILLQHLTPLVPPAVTTPVAAGNHATAPTAAFAVRADTGSKLAPPALAAIQERLASEVTESLASGKALEQMLAAATGEAGSAGHDDLRRIFAGGLHDLLENQRALRDNLRSTHAFLDEMVSERRALREALGKARRDHPFDDATGLLRRTFFLKQVEAECGRARRYGFSLALCLFRVEALEEFADRHGLKLTEQLLTHLSEALRTQYRGYDLLARLGEGELAALLPNTPEAGAVQAARKLLRGAGRMRLPNGGAGVAPPPLRCAVALYHAPESATAFVQRARRTLDADRARRNAEREQVTRVSA